VNIHPCSEQDSNSRPQYGCCEDIRLFNDPVPYADVMRLQTRYGRTANNEQVGRGLLPGIIQTYHRRNLRKRSSSESSAPDGFRNGYLPSANPVGSFHHHDRYYDHDENDGKNTGELMSVCERERERVQECKLCLLLCSDRNVNKNCFVGKMY
jgi:hypothetical protein